MPDYTVQADDIFLDDALNQTAVYWHPTAAGDEGQKGFHDPIEVTVHWESVTETFLDKKSGNTESSRSKIYCDRDLSELGVMWLPPDSGVDQTPGAALAQLTSPTNPLDNEGAYEIRRFDKIPTYDGDEFVRIAYL